MTSRKTISRILFATLVGCGVAALAACSTTVSQFDDDGAGGSGPQCEGFDDVTESTIVTLTVRNATAAPVYLSGSDCSAEIDLHLFDEDDQEVSFRTGNCHFTCEQLQRSEGICAAACALPPIVMLAPGGTYDLAWSGMVNLPVEMPAGCYFGAEYATDTCDQRIVAPSASYAFEVTGYDDSWCPLDQPGACECTPDASGSCLVDSYGDIIGGEGVAARATLSFPSQSAVELVFE